MDILKIFETFPDKKSCIKHLELVRWNNIPTCPYCKSIKQSKEKKVLSIIVILLIAY